MKTGKRWLKNSQKRKKEWFFFSISFLFFFLFRSFFSFFLFLSFWFVLSEKVSINIKNKQKRWRVTNSLYISFFLDSLCFSFSFFFFFLLFLFSFFWFFRFKFLTLGLQQLLWNFSQIQLSLDEYNVLHANLTPNYNLLPFDQLFNIKKKNFQIRRK